MVNDINGYSKARNLYEQHISLWNTSRKGLNTIFEKVNLNLRMRRENKAKLFERFGIRCSIPTG